MPIHKLHLTPKELEDIKPCPFCGSFDLQLKNTHTAAYWIDCNSCREDGFDIRVGGESFDEHYVSEMIPLKNHKRAKKSALLAWNRRSR